MWRVLFGNEHGTSDGDFAQYKIARRFASIQFFSPLIIRHSINIKVGELRRTLELARSLAVEKNKTWKVAGYKSVATLCRFESITKTVLQKGYCAGFIRHKWS
jgi:hypothetical protein